MVEGVSIPEFMPAAVTPFRYGDLVKATRDHLRGRGLDGFERDVCTYLDATAAHSYTSFMRAIYACLHQLRDGNTGEKVVLPRYSCPSFAHAILAAGLEIQYCDVDPRTLTIDLDHLRSLPTDGVLALVCVNHFGLANPMNEIERYCEREDVYLVEDLGYGLGTEYEGARLGTFGDLSVLNFQEGKAIPVGGGMAVRSGSESPTFPRDRPKSRPNLGMMLGYRFFSNPVAYYGFMMGSLALGANVRKRFSMEDTIQETSGEYDYDFEHDEPLYAISDFQGSLGASILDRLADYKARRAENAAKIEEGLSDLGHVRPVRELPKLSDPHYIRYPVLIERGRRDDFKERLLAAGIEASSMYTEHGIDIDADAYPGSAEISERLLTLPCHPNVDDDAIERTIDVLGRA